jgi:phage terminase large subunit GpA-like protein
MNARGVMVQPGMRPLRYEDDWGCMTEDEGEIGDGPLIVDHEVSEVPFRVAWGDPPLRGSPTRLSFAVSGLSTFSVRNSYGYLARRYMEAIRSLLPQRIQGAYNTLFGECYQQKGDTPPWGEVKKLGASEMYSLGDIPDRVTALVASVDLSDDAMQWSIYGFVPETDMECYLVNRGVFYGDTDQDEVWNMLDAKILYAEHGGLKILAMAIDANHRPERVYAYVSERRDVCYATKGVKTMDTWWRAVKAEVDFRGKAKRFGLRLWHINTDVSKSWVHSIRTGEIIWHLPNDIDDDFCKQITSESRLIDVRGVPYWRRHRENHFLDCAALAWFAGNQIKIPAERPVSVQKKVEPKRPGSRSVISSDDPYLR